VKSIVDEDQAGFFDVEDWLVRRPTLIAASLYGLSVLPAAMSAGAQSYITSNTVAFRSLLEIRRDKVVVQKWDLSCGAAVLATILTYQHGDPVSEQEVAEGLIRRQDYIANPSLVQNRQGFSLLDLQRYVAQRGYEGVGFGGLALRDLIRLAPVIVPVSFKGYNHFVVFRGIWDDRVLLADPGWGNRIMRIERFEDAWLDTPKFGRTGFVVRRRDGREPPNQLAPRPSDFVR
jgi:uncharacterized protein